MRRFLHRFRGHALEVALEATTGWRFVVEELRATGANVHLAEPAETAALRGDKKRAKNDRADARHHRELLLAGRLPESWIPPDHILDLRARVKLRHALNEQRAEWQQRIQSVLYHHGCPKRGDLINTAGLAWLAAQPLTACTREQVTIALTMIEALDAQLAPLDTEAARLRSPAPRMQGTDRRPLRDRPTGRGHDPGPNGDCRRFSSSREAVRYAGIDITVYASDQPRAARARAAIPPRTADASLGAVRGRPVRAATQFARPPLLPRDRRTPRRQPRLPGGLAQTAQAQQLPHAARPRRGSAATRMTSPPRAKPFVTQMRRGQLPASSCRHQHVDGHHRQSGRNAFPKRDHPIKHHVAGPEPTRIVDRDKAGRPRAQQHNTTHPFPPTRRRGSDEPLADTPLHHKHGAGPGWKLQPGGA